MAAAFAAMLPLMAVGEILLIFSAADAATADAS